METPQLHRIFLQHRAVSTDSRAITKGCIYFALSGPHFNGNDFAMEAIAKGAAFAVVDSQHLAAHDQLIQVPNVLHALQSLGSYHRNYCKAIVISLTGSNGKTTTKELIFKVLSQQYNTIATQGNLNNHIGVPLSLLSIEEETEFAIIEMGANHQKEIAALCEIAQPDFGCITNYGKAHMEGFGGVAGIIKGKSELYDYLMAHHKTILFNDHDPIQIEKVGAYSTAFSFGHKKSSHYQTSATENKQAELSFNFQNTQINTQLYGDYNTTNCMIAAAIGAHFKVPLSKIKEGIENYKPNNNRSEVRNLGSHQLILDAYNANPSSMAAALNHFSKIPSALPKMAILGDMFELGDTAIAEHQEVVSLLESLAIERIILVGELFAQTKHAYESYPNFEAMSHIEELAVKPSMILIKGSRGMALERVLPLLEN